MKKALKALGLTAMIVGMFYSSLSLLPKKVSANVTCCYYLTGAGCSGTDTVCQQGSNGHTCSHPSYPEYNAFCVKKCNPGMECDEDGGGS